MMTFTKKQSVQFLYKVIHVKNKNSKNEYHNLKKFYDLISRAKFAFRNYFNFAIAAQPKLYRWLKTTDYLIIEKEIAFLLASLYFFVPGKWHIADRPIENL
jgi:hypothetical protein